MNDANFFWISDDTPDKKNKENILFFKMLLSQHKSVAIKKIYVFA